ncbi:MAG: GatB/YqeY domain-containing protein [Candidatus Kapaibacterium sp.]
MGLEEKINEQMKTAMKGGEKNRLETLRSIRAAILEFNKSGIGKAMTEDDEIKLLNSAAKKRRDAIDMYKKGGREELAEKEAFELDVIQEFLPEQLSEDDIRSFVRAKIEESGASGMKDMGKIMGISMKEFKGKADGSRVQQIVREMLGTKEL